MKPSKRARIPAAQEQFTVHGINSTSTMNPAAYDDYKAALDDRRSKGRYTLEEAAMLIAEETGEHADDMLKKLMQAVREGELTVHKPGKLARYQSDTVRDFYEEVYANDLNAWLSENESRIAWRFPDPDPKGASQSATGRPPKAQRWQEQEILRVIRKLKYAANALPKRKKAGAAWVKAEVRTKLNYSAGVFDKAWERLRKHGAIKETP